MKKNLLQNSENKPNPTHFEPFTLFVLILVARAERVQGHDSRLFNNAHSPMAKWMLHDSGAASVTLRSTCACDISLAVVLMN